MFSVLIDVGDFQISHSNASNSTFGSKEGFPRLVFHNNLTKIWIGGKPPKDRPRCGFNNELCPPPAEKPSGLFFMTFHCLFSRHSVGRFGKRFVTLLYCSLYSGLASRLYREKHNYLFSCWPETIILYGPLPYFAILHDILTWYYYVFHHTALPLLNNYLNHLSTPTCTSFCG